MSQALMPFGALSTLAGPCALRNGRNASTRWPSVRDWGLWRKLFIGERPEEDALRSPRY